MTGHEAKDIALIPNADFGDADVLVSRTTGGRRYFVSTNRTIAEIDRDGLRALRDALSAEIESWQDDSAATTPKP